MARTQQRQQLRSRPSRLRVKPFRTSAIRPRGNRAAAWPPDKLLHMPDPALLTLTNYVDGHLVPPHAGRYLDVFEPATGQLFARCPESERADIDAAVRAAQR